MIVADLEGDVIAIRAMLFLLHIHQLQQLQVFCGQHVRLTIEVGSLEGHEGKEVFQLNGILIPRQAKSSIFSLLSISAFFPLISSATIRVAMR